MLRASHNVTIKLYLILALQYVVRANYPYEECAVLTFSHYPCL